MKKELLMSIFMAFFVSTVVVHGQEIDMIKEFPKKARTDSIIDVKMMITNNGSEKNITVMEVISNADPVDPPEFAKISIPEGLITVSPPRYRWNFVLGKNSEKTLTYKIKPNSPEDCFIGPTTVSFGNRDMTFDAKTISVLCNRNGECELSLNENYFNCPEDCQSGGDDGVCDLLADGRCDSDCLERTDPDCQEEKTTTTRKEITTTTVENTKSVCGNDICEKGEDQNSCPEDCETGFPYYLLWLVVIVVVIVISGMIIYESRKVPGENHE